MHIHSIEPIHDPEFGAALDAAIDNKTKPLGSLGMLESLARQIGLIQRSTRPALHHPAILVFAGDHGIVAENVSPYPQSVTWQMVENFLAHGAAINVFAKQHGIALQVVDAGVNHDFGARAGLTDCKVGHSTRNFAQEPAMTREQCERAIERGIALAAAVEGNVLGFGEMGIGNTSAAAAIMHRLTGTPVSGCAGAVSGRNPHEPARLGPADDHGVRRGRRAVGAAGASGPAYRTAPLPRRPAAGGATSTPRRRQSSAIRRSSSRGTFTEA